MVPFLPASLLCIIPFNVIAWLALLGASAASGLLVLRNCSTPLLASDPTHQKAPAVVLAMLAAHVLFFFAIVITFYHHGKAKHMT
jgi:predicted membrane-bound dolichyl-phosphate-mannose-protein mannosyltransferase